MENEWDVLIIGGGPAGLAAAIYSGRALRKTIIFEKKIFGGQIVSAELIENYPGFFEPQVPYQLMEQFTLQAKKYGVVLENDEIIKISRQDFKWNIQTLSNNHYGKAIIFAAGSEYRFLKVKGEKEFLGKGISVCATCDAPFYLNRKVAVIGGGDTAVVEALHLVKFASSVTIIHRRNSLRAEKILQERIFNNSKINFLWNMEVTQFNGDNRLESVSISDKMTKETNKIEFDGVFIAIGTTPNTHLIRDFADLDDSGYAITDIHMSTKSPGLFVAGEVVQGSYRQVAISSGMGVQAFLSCEKHLESLP